MENPKALSSQLKDYAKGTPYSLTFSCFVQKVCQPQVERGANKGIAAYARGPSISHLFFAVDSLIFCLAIGEECSNLVDILEKYELASGQQLNKEKTSLFFSCNTPQNVQDEIKNRFGAEIIRQHKKYLELPSLVGKNKCNTFHQLIERLDNKLSGWKEKLLSNAGNEILIKTVAQVVPTL